MRRYPVVNLQKTLGQIKEFETLTDQQLSRIQGAVDQYNNWKDWDDTPTGDRYTRDAVSDVQSAIDSVPEAIRNGAVDEIRKYVDGADDLIDRLKKPGPTTNSAVPNSNPPVASEDWARKEPAPPPNTNPPVASGQPGPGYSPHNPVASGQPGPGANPPQPQPPESPEPTGFTGSEPEPPLEVQNPPPPPPVQQPPPPAPAPKPAAGGGGGGGGNGCFYTFGKGYSWGARPPSGEPTGLDQAACQNLIALDQQIRGVTPPQGQTAQGNIQNQQPPAQATNVNQPPTPPPGRAPVASGGPTSCGEGQFWDGTKCRGSVSMPGGLANQAMNLGPSGAAAGGITPGNIDINPGSIANTSFGGLGRRIPAKPLMKGRF